MNDAPPQPTLTDALASQLPGFHRAAMVGTRHAGVLALPFQMESSPHWRVH